MDYQALGRRIKEERKKKRLTQGKLAERVNVSVNFISQIELAKSKMSVETFFNIAQALEVGTDSLLGNITMEKNVNEGGIAADMIEAMKKMTPSQRLFVLDHAKGLVRL